MHGGWQSEDAAAALRSSEEDRPDAHTAPLPATLGDDARAIQRAGNLVVAKATTTEPPDTDKNALLGAIGDQAITLAAVAERDRSIHLSSGTKLAERVRRSLGDQRSLKLRKHSGHLCHSAILRTTEVDPPGEALALESTDVGKRTISVTRTIKLDGPSDTKTHKARSVSLLGYWQTTSPVSTPV